jgi:four helix bundle protein
MTYEEREHSVPQALRDDVLWKVKAYRLSLFLADLSWHDAGQMMKDPRLVSTGDQLQCSCGRFGACVAEGYSKGTGRDRVRYYEYSLGSVREARHWYYSGRHCLTTEVLEHRLALTTEILSLVLTMIRNDRKSGRKFEANEE